MSAVLPAAAALVAPAPDSGLFAAVIVAAGVTALVALGMMLIGMHRHSRLTALRGLATVGLALGVVSVAVGGVLAVSPTSAQAASDLSGPTYVVTNDDPDIQLPTLPLD
jgi:formate hydrogenlyase subunit 3/multisubunit Na+/H+ antiporter MnhD subunit